MIEKQPAEAVRDRLAGPWPLVGRRRELRAVAASLRTAGGAVLLVGEAGAGKTSMAKAALDGCRDRDTWVVSLRARADPTSRPFDVARSLLPDAVRSEVAPGLGLTSAVLRRLRAEADGRRVVLGVDDADRLDAGSVGLVLQVAATLGASLLLTCRSDAAADAALAEFLRSGHVLRTDIPPLGRRSTGRLLSSVLDGPVDSASRERLWQLSQGNPHTLRHLLLRGLDKGWLLRDDCLWWWSDRPVEPVVALVPTIRACLESLSGPQRAALRTVALAEPVPLSVVERTADPIALEELEQRQIIVVRGPEAAPTVAMAHPVYGEVVRAEVPPAARRATFGELADAAAGSHVHRRPVREELQLLRWQVAAGQRIAASESVAAAREALAAGDAAFAEVLARQTWPTGGGPELARALVAQGRAQEAEEVLDRLADATERDELAALRALNLLWGCGNPEGARRVIAKAAESPGIRLADAAFRLFARGEGTAPVAVSEIATGISDPVLSGCAQVVSGFQATFSGRPSRLLRDLDEGVVRPLDGWVALRTASEVCQVHALGLAGRLGDATATVERLHAEAVHRQDRAAIGALALETAVVAMWSGDYRRAHAASLEARRHLDETTPPLLRAYLASEHAVCEAALGRLSRAVEVLRIARQAFPPGSGLRDHLEWGEIRVEMYAGRSSAVGRLEALTSRQLRDGRLASAAEGLVLLARARRDADAAAHLRRVADECDSALFQVYADFAQARAIEDPIGLKRVADELEPWGYRPLALEAAALARELDADADQRLASELSRQTTRLTRRCQGFRPPWMPACPDPVPLTRREREICRLVARGLTNAMIADHLSIADRTVTNHLQRSYEKMGVSNRHELLAELAAERALPRENAGQGPAMRAAVIGRVPTEWTVEELTLQR